MNLKSLFSNNVKISFKCGKIISGKNILILQCNQKLDHSSDETLDRKTKIKGVTLSCFQLYNFNIPPYFCNQKFKDFGTFSSNNYFVI